MIMGYMITFNRVGLEIMVRGKVRVRVRFTLIVKKMGTAV